MAASKTSTISIAHYDIKHVDFRQGRLQATIKVTGAHKSVLDTVNLYSKAQRLAFISEVSVVLGQPKSKTEAEIFLLISFLENREKNFFDPELESTSMAKPVLRALKNPKFIDLLFEQLKAFNYPIIEDLFLAYLAVLSSKTRHPILLSLTETNPLYLLLRQFCPKEVDLSAVVSVEAAPGRIVFHPHERIDDTGTFQDRTLDDFSNALKQPQALHFLHTLFRLLKPVTIVMDPTVCPIPESLPKRLSVLYLQCLESIALLRQSQKKSISHDTLGLYFEVDSEDIEITDRVIVPILRRLTSELPPSSRVLLSQIRDHCSATHTLVFTRRDIRQKYDWEPTGLHRQLHTLCKLDYIRVKGLPNGYAHTYILIEDAQDA